MLKKLINHDAWKAISVAIIILLVGQGILAWQYYRLQERQLPQIEEKLDAQQKEIELTKADKALELFMNIRSSGSQEQVRRYLTERSVEEGIPSISSFDSYNIIQTEVLEGDRKSVV